MRPEKKNCHRIAALRLDWAIGFGVKPVVGRQRGRRPPSHLNNGIGQNDRGHPVSPPNWPKLGLPKWRNLRRCEERLPGSGVRRTSFFFFFAFCLVCGTSLAVSSGVTSCCSASSAVGVAASLSPPPPKYRSLRLTNNLRDES